MPNPFESLIPGPPIDYVAIYSQNFSQLFRLARPIKAVVKEEAKLMEHPVETGSVITDHRIILPVEIELSLVIRALGYLDTYKALKQYYLNGTLLVIQTKSGVYPNQIIGSMPHEEDPEQYDSLIVALNLKQVLFVTAQYQVVPRDPKNQSTVDRGTQQGIVPDAKTNSVATAAYDSLKKYFKQYVNLGG